MPTISGMRRRGVTAAAIRSFCDQIGVAKTNSQVDMAILDAAIRRPQSSIASLYGGSQPLKGGD